MPGKDTNKRQGMGWCLMGAALLACLALSVPAAAGRDTVPMPRPDAGGAAKVAQLIENKGCPACHDRMEQRIGPPYELIAQRHAARKEIMVEVLAHKIVYGGAGNWGIVPMVANKHVTVNEAREMAQWIMQSPETR